ncbi:ester cyclase [Kutzneria chonburiensis]|uniref:Ester cyclase n=1 Tax=Kutzneria chonburiensis TaxID=1483604 RepID=A0ABV6N8E8_9PSEU|nr:ester cyclase [Kutzneria chonburiensis]
MQLPTSIAVAATLGALVVGGVQAYPSSPVTHNTELGREFVVLENDSDATDRQRLAHTIVSPDYLQHNAIVPPGRDGLLTFLRGVRVVMPDVRFTSRDVFATDDRVVSRFTVTGTVTGGPFVGVPAGGQHLEWDGVDIWTVRGGRLYEHWDQFDWPRALIQLGVKGLPQPFVQAAAQPVNR